MAFFKTKNAVKTRAITIGNMSNRKYEIKPNKTIKKKIKSIKGNKIKRLFSFGLKKL